MQFGIKVQRVLFVTNMVASEEEGKKIYNKFNDIVTQFYDVNISYVGSILMMNEINNSILNKKPAILDKKNIGIISLFDRILNNINNSENNKFNGIKFFNSA